MSINEALPWRWQFNAGSEERQAPTFSLYLLAPDNLQYLCGRGLNRMINTGGESPPKCILIYTQKTMLVRGKTVLPVT